MSPSNESHVLYTAVYVDHLNENPMIYCTILITGVMYPKCGMAHILLIFESLHFIGFVPPTAH